MRAVLKLSVAGALAALTLGSAAQAAQIRYSLSGFADGNYRQGGVGALQPFNNASVLLNFYGETSTASVQANSIWVDTTAAAINVGNLAGGANLGYFGGDRTVFAVGTGPASGFAQLTEVENGQLQPGGIFQGAGLVGYGGTTNLAPTAITALDIDGPGVDLALANGTLIFFDAVRNTQFSATLLGGTAADPLIPGSVDAGGFHFSFDAVGGVPVYIDPAVAIGYDYILGAGSPLITQASFSAVPDSVYEIYALGDLGTALFSGVLGGQTIDFTSLPAFLEGINGFSLRGINPAAGLDPAGHGFVTGLTFAADGPVDLTQLAITSGVPEPASWAMMLAGFFGLGAALRIRRRRRRDGLAAA